MVASLIEQHLLFGSGPEATPGCAQRSLLMALWDGTGTGYMQGKCLPPVLSLWPSNFLSIQKLERKIVLHSVMINVF